MPGRIVTLQVTVNPERVTSGELRQTKPCEIVTFMGASAKIGRAFRRIRLSQGITAEDAGEAIGISKVEMTRKERGLSAFSVDQMEALARYYGVPMIEVVNEASSPQDEIYIELMSGIAALDNEARIELNRLVQRMLPRNKRVRSASLHILPPPKKP